MKKIKHARNGDERGGALLPDRSNDFGGIAGRFDNYCGSQQRRNKQCHKLPEDVAQWNERNEAQGMQPAFVFAIRIDAAFEWLKIGKKISVCEHNAARLGRCAGSVENFRNRVSRGCFSSIHARMDYATQTRGGSA